MSGDSDSEDPYNSGSFTQDDNSEYGVFGDSSGSSDDANDYQSWDWKQIKAAINGGSAITSEFASQARQAVDPQTLRLASAYFSHAEQTMAKAAKSIKEQAEALAGEEGPWKGPAAKAFLSKVQTFAMYMDANAERLRGGDGSGYSSVATSLHNSGNYLAWAQNALNQLDTYYANLAKIRGASTGDGGLIMVHEDPEVVEAMTRDMREVADKLATNYGGTNAVLTAAKDFSMPSPNSEGGGAGPNVPDPNVPDPNVPDPNVPDPNVPDPNVPDPNVPDPNVPDPNVPDPNVPDPNGQGPVGSGPNADSPPVNQASVDPPPVDQPSANSANTPVGDGPQIDPPGVNGPGGAEQPPVESPQLDAPPPSTGGAGDGAQTPPVTPPGVTPPPTTGGGTGAGNDRRPQVPPVTSPELETPPGGNVPGTDTPGGAGSGSELPGVDSPGTGDTPPVTQPPVVEPPALDAPPVSGGSGSGADLNRGGMPMMPPMSPGAGGGGAGSGGERSDASGLLDGGPEAWSDPGSGPALGDPSAPQGAISGGPGLDTPPVAEPPVVEQSPESTGPGEQVPAGGGGAVPGGMPMMPPMSPGAGAGGSGSERSDASGLLDGGPEAWSGQGSGPAPGDPSAPQGAASGGPGLDTSAPAEPAGASPVAESTENIAPPPGEPLADTTSGEGNGNPVPEAGSALRGPAGGTAVPADFPLVGAVPVIPPVGPPPVLGDGQRSGAGERREAERDDSAAAEAPAAPESTVVADPVGGTPNLPVGLEISEPSADTVGVTGAAVQPDPPADHVAIVRQDGAKDTSSWDLPEGGLPWLVPFSVPADQDTDRSGDRPDPGHVLRDSAPWQQEEEAESSGFAVWRRANLGAPPPREQAADDGPLLCGGPTLTREQAEELRAERAKAKAEAEAEAARAAKEAEEEAAAAEQERSSADLVARDSSAWGGGPAVPPSGGIG